MELIPLGTLEQSIGEHQAADLLRLAAESSDASLPLDERVESWSGFVTGVIKVCGTPGVDVERHNAVYNSAYRLSISERHALVKFDDDLWRDLSRLTIGAERFDADAGMSLYDTVKMPDWRSSELHPLRTQLFEEIRRLQIS